MKNLLKLSLCLGLILVYTSCDDDDQNGLPFEVPETYSFENVDYSGQTQRLDMLNEMKIYMKTSQTGAALNADILEAMYANDRDNAGWVGDYETSKQLRSKTFESEQPVFDELLVAIAGDSQSGVPGTEGQAGVVESLDGSKSYLLSANGLDLGQIIEKGIMGACFFYQATGVYLEPGRMDVDNETVTPGRGTDMEHHWDEAFGYLGVATDFPANINDVRFWGNYTAQRNELLGSGNLLMLSFRKGRAAISNDDLATRDAAITEIKFNWETVSAATAINYINRTIADFDDMAIRGHLLSEAIAFVYALQFNPDARVSLTDVRSLLTLLGGDDEFSNMDLYNITTTSLQEAKDQLAQIYGLENVKDEL